MATLSVICNGQTLITLDRKIYQNTETNKMFVRGKEPIYLFMSYDKDKKDAVKLNSESINTNPMYLDGQGVHFLKHKGLSPEEKIMFTLYSDEDIPKTNLKLNKKPLFSNETRSYCENDVEITLESKDFSSGLYGVYYSVNNGEYQPYKSPIKLDNDIEINVKYYAIDNVGNMEPLNEKVFVTGFTLINKISNIYYDKAKWNIRNDAALELDKLVALLNKYPEIIIELGSHTDCRGFDLFNKVLSVKRAKAAVEYLISKGIDDKRLQYKGYGETMLINKCKDGYNCTEEQHEKNRRTEFKIIGIKK